MTRSPSEVATTCRTGPSQAAAASTLAADARSLKRDLVPRHASALKRPPDFARYCRPAREPAPVRAVFVIAASADLSDLCICVIPDYRDADVSNLGALNVVQQVSGTLSPK